MSLASGVARVLDIRYAIPTFARSYDVSLDGKRFLMIKENPAGEHKPPPSIVVVLNWLEELKARLGAPRGRP